MPFISFPAENRAPGRKKGAEQVRLDAGKGREGVREEPWAGWGAWAISKNGKVNSSKNKKAQGQGIPGESSG